MIHVEFVYIASFSNWSNVIDTNIIPQMDEVRRLRQEYYCTFI